MNQASIDTTGSPTPETPAAPGAEAPKASAAAQKTTQKAVRKTAIATSEPEAAAAVPAKALKPVKPAKTVKPAPVAKPAPAASPATVKPAAVKKPSKVVKPVKAVKPLVPAQESVTLKVKLVRDSFTMPELEYAQLDALKQRSLSLAHHAKKSEVLRAGITALAAMGDAELLAALQAVPPLKTGRPKSRKSDKADKVNGEIKLRVTPKAVSKAAPKALAKPAGKTRVTARKG